jgi:hypothetical protein
MVVVLGLALLGQVAVGLDAVLEAVQLAGVSGLAQQRSGTRYCPLLFAFGRSEREQGLCGDALTSQHEFAIWQPAWPTRRVQSQQRQIAGGSGEAVRRIYVGSDIPFRLMTSLMAAKSEL